MPDIALQISPEAKNAYFKDYLDVARQELEQVFSQQGSVHSRFGNLEFLNVNCELEVLPQLLRLSFVQGAFLIEGKHLTPMDYLPRFELHEDFVFAAKYKGKTNERLTQMMLNIGMAAIGRTNGEGLKLLDPMCGRATTLLWAMRYGMKARGIEQDPKVLPELVRTLKASAKVHRQKHTLRQGSLGKAKKSKEGAFLEFCTPSNAMKVIIGDTTESPKLLEGEKFELLVSDLPYGIQHFTTAKTRNPLPVLQKSLEQWRDCLKPGGAIVLAFNSYIPKRTQLVGAAESAGLEAQTFAAPHRMSESIVRDVVILKHAG